MKKKVFLTCLEKNESLAGNLMETFSRYGLAVDGNFFIDDLDRMAWATTVDGVEHPDIAAWCIAGGQDSFAKASVRCGLSLSALSAMAAKGHNFPILACITGETSGQAELPTPLRSAEIVSPGALGAKIAAKANVRAQSAAPGYRLRPIAMPGVGLWLELGPHDVPWNGVLLGVADAEINAQGIGPSGTVPARSTLEYPFRGMGLRLGGTEYQAWGASNALTPGSSCYTRLTGTPTAFVFGELPTDDHPELFSVRLT